MRNSALPTLRLSIAAAYFAIAAAASVYLSAEAWHVQFFATPYGAILSLLGLFYISASAFAVATLCKNRHTRFVILGLFAIVIAVAAHKGSYFASRDDLARMFMILSAAVGCIFFAMSKAAASKPGSTTPNTGWIHCAAVLLPIPIIAYCLLSFCVRQTSDASQLSSGGSTAPIAMSARWAFISCENFLFGTDRADRHLHELLALSQQAELAGKLATAESLVRQQLELGEAINGVIWRYRLQDSRFILANLCEKQGKFTECDSLYEEVDDMRLGNPPDSGTVFIAARAWRMLAAVPEPVILDASSRFHDLSWWRLLWQNKGKSAYELGRSIYVVDMRPRLIDVRKQSEKHNSNSEIFVVDGQSLRKSLAKVDPKKPLSELSWCRPWLSDGQTLSSLRESLPGPDYLAAPGARPPFFTGDWRYANGSFPKSAKELVPVELICMSAQDMKRLKTLTPTIRYVVITDPLSEPQGVPSRSPRS